MIKQNNLLRIAEKEKLKVEKAGKEVTKKCLQYNISTLDRVNCRSHMSGKWGLTCLFYKRKTKAALPSPQPTVIHTSASFNGYHPPTAVPFQERRVGGDLEVYARVTGEKLKGCAC